MNWVTVPQSSSSDVTGSQADVKPYYKLKQQI
jgi:hypothetical protein